MRGLTFTARDWENLRAAGEPVWLLHLEKDEASETLRGYIDHGEELGVPTAYKCQVPNPVVAPPAGFSSRHLLHVYEVIGTRGW